MNAEALKRIFKPINVKLANIFTRSEVVSVDSSKDIYVVLSKVRGKKDSTEVKLMQQFGFASVAPSGADQCRVHLSSDPDNPLIISQLHRESQPTDLSEGDSAVFDSHNNYMKFKVDGINIFSELGNIELNAPAGDVVINSLSAEVNALTTTINSATATYNGQNLNLNASSAVNITSPLTNVLGPITCSTVVTAASFALAGGLLFEDHVHKENNGPTNITDGPQAP